MGLELSEIRDQINNPSKKLAISRAVSHQNRIRFHAQVSLSCDYSGQVMEFFNFVQNLLPSDKFKDFKELFRYPVKTNELTGICFDRLSRIFDGRNPAFNYQFMSTEQRDDWEYYRQDVLREPEVWSTDGWEHFKTDINSILVVDVPEYQKQGSLPEPYFYWLPIDNVITFKSVPSTGMMDWIIFRQEDRKIAVIDNERYRLFSEDNGNIGELLLDNPHDIGYCPARFFWREPISLKEPDVKESPLTKELEALDWYLFYYVSKRNLDLFGAYPIYSGYEQSCDFTDSSGDCCSGGFLKDKHGQYKYDSAGVLCRCPKCGEKRIKGAGSFITIPVPDGDSVPDLKNPVQVLTVDRNSLDYNVEEEERLRINIITSVVGTNEEVATREAVNEKQVKAGFESQSIVLNRIKKGFEDAQKFVDETVCRLRYGDSFVSAKINYGTEFYLFDVEELRKRYKSAKDSGASEAELDALQTQLIETEFRHNPSQLQRMLILAELEPYRHLSRNEAGQLYSSGLMTEEDFMIKMDFSNLIRRFERENINILEFGTQIPFSKKIDIINQKLKDYVSERKRPEEKSEPSGSDA